MGSFEVFHFWFITNILVSIVIILLSIISFKNIYKRFGIFKNNRRNFYECGFRSVYNKTILISIQFFFLIVFFIIYDIELLFSFPLISSISNHLFFDFIIFIFLYLTFIFTLFFDFDRLLTNWYI